MLNPDEAFLVWVNAQLRGMQRAGSGVEITFKSREYEEKLRHASDIYLTYVRERNAVSTHVTAVTSTHELTHNDTLRLLERERQS